MPGQWALPPRDTLGYAKGPHDLGRRVSSALEGTIARCRRTLVDVIAASLVIAGCTAAPSATDSATPPPIAQTSATASPSPSTESTPMPDPLPTEIIVDPDAALLRAAEAGDADAAARALRAGADVEARNDLQQTALLLASAADHTEVARMLVAHGADPDAVDHRSDTPWLVTGVTGSVEMLEILLPAGPDLTLTNRFGGLSPIPAAERGHVEYLRRVVQTDVDINHVNNLGWTALLEVVILGDGSDRYVETVRVLLEGGSDPSIPDGDGVTAAEHARRKGFRGISQALSG